MELQLQHLNKHYGTERAVDDVSTTLTTGVYGLLGANGAGKTTLRFMSLWLLVCPLRHLALTGGICRFKSQTPPYRTRLHFCKLPL